MRISDWSSDVCSSDLLTECKPGLFTGLLKRGDALRGFVAVGKSGATGFGSVMLCTGGGEIGTRFVQAAFQLLALSIQPFQREGGFVSSAERFAEHLIGAGERGSACRQLFPRLLGRFTGRGKPGILRFPLYRGIGARPD